MDPKGVKLSILMRIKLTTKAFFTGENSFGPIAIAILAVLGLFLSLSVPSFMTNVVANCIMHFMLAVVFDIMLIGGLFLCGNFYEEEFSPWYRQVKEEYEKLELVEQKKKIEEVDDILLR